MNVVIWARVSSREQREGYSLDAQLRANREKATKSGWTVVKEFVVSESAKRGAERQAFNEMMAWVKSNAKRQKIQAILSHKLDRACRNMRDAVRLQELEDTLGVQLVFVENQFGGGAAGLFSFNVMAAVAQYYSDNLRSEVLKGIDEKYRQGWPNGLAPFGYMNTKVKEAPIQPDPVESKALIRIFDLYATGHYTLDLLSEKLAEEGYTYLPSQPKFGRTKLAYFLNNRFYLGELHRKGQVFQGKYKLIVPRDLFERCQNILHGRVRHRPSPEKPLTGLFRCAHCGFAMTSELIRRKLKNGSVREHYYLRCGNNKPGLDHPTVRWHYESLEEKVYEDLKKIQMPSQEMAKWFRSGIEAILSDSAEVSRMHRQNLTKRKSELANMQDRLLNAYIGGNVEEAAYKAKSEELKREQKQVQASLEQASQENDKALDLALSVFDFSQNVAEMWRGSNPEARREILECVSLNRTISNVSIDIPKKKPFDFLAERLFVQSSRGDRI